MEKNKQSNGLGSKFTAQERKDLKTELIRDKPGQRPTKFKKTDIEAFIDDLERHCNLAISVIRFVNPAIIDKSLAPVNLSTELSSVLKDLKKALVWLKFIRPEGDLPISHPRTVPEFENYLSGHEPQDRMFQIAVNSMAAHEHLKRLVTDIEEIKSELRPRRGRPSPNQFGFIEPIVRLWKNHFKKTPPKYKDSAFFNTVCVALKAVGLPHEDPSSAIAKIL